MVMVGWKFPEENWVKLNTDGACMVGSSSVCGGIIHDMHGICKVGNQCH